MNDPGEQKKTTLIGTREPIENEEWSDDDCEGPAFFKEKACLSLRITTIVGGYGSN